MSAHAWGELPTDKDDPNFGRECLCGEAIRAGERHGHACRFTRLPTIDYTTIDPGVRGLVAWLRAHGFNTTDSGDGRTKVDAIASGDALDVPHVHIRIEDEKTLVNEATRLASRLADVLGDFPDTLTIEATYSPLDFVATISVLGIDDDDAAAFRDAACPAGAWPGDEDAR